MRYGISKCFQFLINGLKVRSPFSKFFVECTNLQLPPLAIGDVIVGFQNRSRPPVLVSPQGPSARHYHLGSVSPGLFELTVPTVGTQQLRANLLNRRWKSSPQKLVSTLPGRFLRRPAIQLLCSSIPISDDVTHITDENGVVGKIQQAGLLSSLSHFDFELVASLTKVSLDAASNGAEPGDQRCEHGENEE